MLCITPLAGLDFDFGAHLTVGRESLGVFSERAFRFDSNLRTDYLKLWRARVSQKAMIPIVRLDNACLAIHQPTLPIFK